MNVELRCYGAVRTALGAQSLERSLPEGATVATVLDRLGEANPDFARLARDEDGVVVMRDRTHLDRDAPLADGDVVSLSTSPVRD
ncbi:MoaD/ThiS family protein [Haloplanus natans]|uniref:MoaD/ThiS family protein n=1 Tax=Haloplanus natans TaxID=376171 RepID=UPI000677E7A9|nr:MoaD/ThiS family protein [Haloplanus natans]